MFSYELRPFLGVDGLYDLDMIRQRKAEYEDKVASGSPVEGYPNSWRAANGDIFSLRDWSGALAEAEQANARGGYGFTPTGDRSEWMDRDGRPE